jgi:hypothetical protein
VKSEHKFCKTPRQPPFADAFLTACFNQPVSALGLSVIQCGEERK